MNAGDRIADRFEVLGQLGRGGMGVVYLVLDQDRGERVALKMLQRLSGATLLQFKREFRELAEIVHPNLVALHELFSDREGWFYTMAWVRGLDFCAYTQLPGPLHDYYGVVEPGDDQATTVDLAPGLIAARGEPVADFDEGRLRSALPQLVAGVQAIHDAGELHRDIKPNNVRVTSAGHLVVLDFGLVQPRGGTADLGAGTPAYVAPEILAGDAPGPASDWYALGVMLYEVLTGQRPFSGAWRGLLRAKASRDWAVALHNRRLPDDLSRLCARLLEPQPADRPSGEEIAAILGGKSPRLPALASAEGVFVGRNEELGRLRQAHSDHLESRAPIIVLVRGSSGIGKTALVEHFVSRPFGSGERVVLRGRCFPRESVPFNAFDRAVDALVRWLRNRGGVPWPAFDPTGLSALMRVFPVFRVFSEGTAAASAAPVGDDLAVRQRAFATLKRLLGQVADRHSVVLFLDDIQWADGDSAMLADVLLGGIDPLPLLVVATCRSEAAESGPLLRALRQTGRAAARRSRLRELTLGALSPKEVKRLVLARLSGDLPDREGRAERIAEDSGGHPIFAQELSLSGRALACPASTLDELVAGRLGELSPRARRLLEIVAVAGHPVEQRTAAAAAGGLCGGDLTRLQSHRWMHFSGMWPSAPTEVYHDRIRDAVVRELSQTTRQDRHRRLAEALERGGGADAETLVTHYRAAGLIDEAIGHAPAAAARAFESLAFDRAARLYELAGRARNLDAGERASLKVRLGEALEAARRPAEAAQAYRRAALEAPPGQRADLRRRAAKLLHQSHSVPYAESAASMRDAYRDVGLTLPRTSPVALARLLVARTRLRLRGMRVASGAAGKPTPAQLARIDACWDATTALTVSDRPLDALLSNLASAHTTRLAFDTGEPRRLARALLQEAINISIEGTDPSRARAMLRLAGQLRARFDDPYVDAYAAHTEAWLALFRGHLEEATGWASVGEAMFLRAPPSRRGGAAWEVMSCRVVEAMALRLRGRVPEIAESVLGFQEEARARDNRMEQALYLPGRCLVALARDRLQEARATIDDARARLSRSPLSLSHFLTGVARTLVTLYEGEEAAAGPLLRDLAKAAPAMPMYARVFRTHMFWVSVGRLASRTPWGAGSATAGVAWRLERDPLLSSRAVGALLAAERLFEAGARARARSKLEQAVGTLDAAGLQLDAAAARRALGRLYGGDRGRALRNQADAAMAALGVVDPERMSALFTPVFATRARTHRSPTRYR